MVKASRKKTMDNSFQAARGNLPLGMVRIPSAMNPGPNCYAVGTVGTCLQPEIYDGERLICDPDRSDINPADVVAIWFKDPARPPAVKKMELGFPEPLLWNLKGDNCQFCLSIEQINPPLHYDIPLCKIDRVHKVTRKVSANDC